MMMNPGRLPNRHEIIWPEWSDADVNNEKWELPKAPDKAKSKQSGKSGSAATSATTEEIRQYEDPYPVFLPASLHTKHSWVRPSVLSPTLKLVMYSGGLMYPDLVSNNRHLLHCTFMRGVITAVNTLLYLGYTHPFVVEWETSQFTPNTSGSNWKPWHHVYSLCRAGRDQNHLPQVNSMGKYIVRLYWMGCWRKVYVDDRYPVDASGRALVPRTGNEKELELWPALLTKALLKIASLTWTNQEEIVDFDIVACLTGWVVEKVTTKGLVPPDIWEMCCGYSDHFTWEEDEPPTKSKGTSGKNSATSKSSKDSKGSKGSKSSKGSKGSKGSKKAKSTKSVVTKPPFSFHLIASCRDLREADEQLVNDFSPCFEHEFVIDQSRNIPLIKKVVDTNKQLAPWKTFRWVDWACQHGLWEKDEILENIKCLKVISNLRKFNNKDNIDIRKSQEETEIRQSVKIIEETVQKKAKDKKGGKGGKDKKDKKSDKGKKGSDKGSKKKEIVEFVDPSVWCNFHNLGQHITSLSIYYKPSCFKTNVVVSDIKFQGTSDPKSKKAGKKDDKKGKADSPAPLENTVKFVYWPEFLTQSRNEPFYLFTDSIDAKLFVINFAHVSNFFPEPIPKVESEFDASQQVCKKLVCKLNKCTGICFCQGPPENMDQPPELNFIDTRIRAYVIMEDFSWKNLELGKMSFVFDTLGVKTHMINFGSGRRIKRFWLRTIAPFAITFISDSDMQIGRIDEVLDSMTAESELLTNTCYNICSAFGELVRVFGTPSYPLALRSFYSSYIPTLGISKSMQAKIHDCFQEELINILAGIYPVEKYYLISRAFRILLLDPHFRIPNPNFIVPKKNSPQEEPWNPWCVCVDKDGMRLRDVSAVKIQSYFKKIYMQKLKALHDPYDKNFNTVLDILKQVYTNTFSNKTRSNCIELLRNLMRNEKMKDLTKYFPFYNDLNHVVVIKNFHGDVTNITPNSWLPITRQTFFCYGPEPISIRAYMFCTLPKFMLRIFNNDTGEEINRYTNNALVHKYEKNEKGYTILAYEWVDDVPTGNVNWKLYLVIDKVSNNPPVTLNPVVIQTFQLRGNFVPNLDNLIFKCSARILDTSLATFHCKVSSENVRIKIQCLNKHGKILYEATGKTNVLIPATVLVKENEPEPTISFDNVPSLESRTMMESRKSLRRSKGSSKKKSSSEKRSTRSAGSVKRNLIPQISLEIDPLTEFTIQAFVLNDSWPLTTNEWQLVQKLRTRNFIEDELNLSPSGSIFSSPRKSLKSGSKKSLSSRRSKERKSSIFKSPENNKPFWILSSIVDSGNFVEVIIDRRRSEQIKDIKRKCFEEDPTRLRSGMELRKEFLDKHYIKWGPEVSEEDTIIQTDLSSQFNTEDAFELPSKITLRSKIFAPPQRMRNLQTNVCPECNKAVIPEEFAYLKAPQSIHKMLPPFEVNKYEEEMYPYRWLISTENEEKIFINMNLAIENFEDTQQQFLDRMTEYLEKCERNNDFFAKWYEDIRADSNNMIQENEMAREKYIKELKEELLEQAASQKSAKSKGKKKK